MKVILLNNVPKLGKKYEVKEVADGHALNFLMPKGLVQLANAKNMEKLDALRAQSDAENKVQEDLLAKNLKSIEGITVTISEKANEQGHLFAGIHKDVLIAEIKKQTGLDITPEYIELEKPIKTTGEFDIEVKVQDKKASFKLVVEAI